MLTLLQRRVGRKWARKGKSDWRNWFHVPAFVRYVDETISPEHETGVTGALRAFLGDERLKRGVSIGAGFGAKELRIARAGLVERFELFELSEKLAEAAQAAFADEGLGDRVEVHIRDFYGMPADGRFDLVYWDHALHHMLDVERALRWSIDALRPGGLLVVNDYVGPTRLQWKADEVAEARRFLDRFAGELKYPADRLRPGNAISRLRMIWRDHTEAPQSDRIMDAFARLTGGALRPLGGTMLHLCTPFLPGDAAHPAYTALIEHDRRALERGYTHFAFGIWRKPAAGAAADAERARKNGG